MVYVPSSVCLSSMDHRIKRVLEAQPIIPLTEAQRETGLSQGLSRARPTALYSYLSQAPKPPVPGTEGAGPIAMGGGGERDSPLQTLPALRHLEAFQQLSLLGTDGKTEVQSKGAGVDLARVLEQVIG